MGYDGKYGVVTTEHGDIPPDELVFVLRARDSQSVKAILDYAAWCRQAGCSDFHVELAESAAQRFSDWQEANPDKVRLPDSEAHRERLTRPPLPNRPRLP